MTDNSSGSGKVVVNRALSLDGFIAGPGDMMDWTFDFMAPESQPLYRARLRLDAQSAEPARPDHHVPRW